MVGRAPFILALLATLLLPAVGQCASPSFRLAVQSAELEYGKPIRVQLQARNLSADLATLDLSPLDPDFVVETPNDVVRNARNRLQTWRIRLYPRQAGQLQIPSLAFQGTKTRPLTVEVKPAVDQADKTAMKVSTQVSDTNVWLNQPVHVTVQVESGSRYAWLESPAARQDGIDIVAEPHTRDSETRNGEQRTQHRIGWVLYPQTTGTISLQLPRIEYYREGVATHRFYPPRLVLHVRALPAFVPPTMPIGRVRLEESLPPGLFMVKNKLDFFTLRIHGQGPPGQRLSGVLRQLKSSSDITIYPARDLAGNGAVHQGREQEVAYQVPFAPQSLGRVSLPRVRLQYFDPETGMIETRIQPLGRFIVLDQWTVYAGALVLLLVAIRLGGVAYRYGKRQLRLYTAYRKALWAFRHASTPEEIRSGLMEIARGESWSGNLTLAAWLKQWSMRYPKHSSLSASIECLQACLYGRVESNLLETKTALIDACRRRLPLRRMQSLLQQ
jgi:hypothetical protein